jgi:hypothetical protein
MPLAVFPCRSLCAWRATEATDGGLRVFSCTGCGSQWTRTRPWTPIDADGHRAPDLLAELAMRGPVGPDGPDSAVDADSDDADTAANADHAEAADRPDRRTTSGS